MSAFNQQLANFHHQKETFRAYLKEENQKLRLREIETQRLKDDNSTQSKALYIALCEAERRSETQQAAIDSNAEEIERCSR